MCLCGDAKRGFIAESASPLLNQFGIDPNLWLAHVQRFGYGYGYGYGYCAGSRENILNYAEIFSRKTAKGVGVSCSKIYKVSAL